jgi:lipoate-protein ligase A
MLEPQQKINLDSFRFIDSNKATARENMAIDEALFSFFDEDSKPIFRLYNWTCSYSVGVNQPFSIAKIQNNDYAKRMTGGGVLFHGNDISYSFILNSSLLKGYSVKKSYEIICLFLMKFYKSIGLSAYFAKDDSNISFSKNAFCQLGFEEYDILINGKKIGGNAQKRNKKVIFQHGSISLNNICNWASNSGFNLQDFGVYLSINQAKDKLLEAFESSFNTKKVLSNLTDKEYDLYQNLLKDKYDYNK